MGPKHCTAYSFETLRGTIVFIGVAVKEFGLNYHNSEALLCTIFPYHGNLIEVL